MTVWGARKLEEILEIAVGMEDWAPAGLQQVLAPPPSPCQASTRSSLLLGDSRGGSEPRGGGCGGGGVRSGKAWDSHYLLTSTEASQCISSPSALTLRDQLGDSPAPAQPCEQRDCGTRSVCWRRLPGTSERPAKRAVDSSASRPEGL